MSAITLDFEKTVADFERAFEDVTDKRFNESPVAGVNFMTPDVLATYEVNGYFVEISTGVFLGERFFGFAVRANGAIDDRSEELSGCIEASTIEDVRKEYDYIVKDSA